MTVYKVEIWPVKEVRYVHLIQRPKNGYPVKYKKLQINYISLCNKLFKISSQIGFGKIKILQLSLYLIPSSYNLERIL